MSLLNVIFQVVGYEDAAASQNPQQRNPDWRRQLLAIPASNPQAPWYDILPMQEVSIFDGARSLTYDGTTEFDLTLSPVASDRYRLAWTGTGTAPGFRTARVVPVAGGSIIIAVQSNQSVLVTHSDGAVFGAVVAGDTVLIPGGITGDADLFDPLNAGFWEVVGATSTQLTLARTAGEVFSGSSETVVVASDSEFQVFSSSGVQVDDTLDIVSGFAPAARAAFEVVSVAAGYVEFLSSSPLAEQEAIVPGASSLAVYGSSKRLVCVESNQEVALMYNGSTDEGNRISPLSGGVGFDLKTGIVYSLSIKNRSTKPARVMVISAE